MSADIFDFRGATVIPIESDKVLDAAKDADLAMAFVIGRHQSGAPYMAGTHSELGELLLLLERAKLKLLEMAE